MHTLESTPALLIDLPAAKRNIDRLAGYARDHGLKIRPHTKTHKSLRMARLQLEAGCDGLTTAKVGEAQIMSQVCDDLFVAYPAIDPWRARHLAELARKTRVRVALDTPAGVDAIAPIFQEAGVTVGVLIDLDVGMHRTGVQSPADALELARKIDKTKSLRLDGLFFYPGQIWGPSEQVMRELAGVEAILEQTIELWQRDGHEARIISGGSTPTAYQSHRLRHVTEIRPGTYIYNDMNTYRRKLCSLEDCAARIVCTVVSDAVPGKMVIDAGSKTLAADPNIPEPDSGHGHVLEFPRAKIVKLSEEHGEVDISECDGAPRVGQRVTVIPNHICPCINLQDSVWLRLEDGSIEPMPIDARGKLA